MFNDSKNSYLYFPTNESSVKKILIFCVNIFRFFVALAGVGAGTAAAKMGSPGAVRKGDRRLSNNDFYVQFRLTFSYK